MPPEKAPLFLRHNISIRIPLLGVLDAAGAVTFLLSAVAGYVFSFERMLFIPDVAAAGAGATQTFRLRKGNASGAILDTIILTLANAVLGTAGVASTGVSAANDTAARLADADTYSLTKDAGTVFTAGGGTLHLVVRQKPQHRI